MHGCQNRKDSKKVNKKLIDAKFDIEKADALMYAIETTYLNIDVKPEEEERRDKGVYAFYALWDIIKKVSKELDEAEPEMYTEAKR